MNATGLPIPTSGPSSGSTSGTAATPPAAVPAVAPADFLLMLGQLLGGSTSQNAGGAAKPALPASSESEPAESDGTDALAMLSILPMMPWSNPQNQSAAAAAGASGSLSLMSLAAGGAGGGADSAARDALLLASLTDALKTDDAGTSVPNLNAQQSLEMAQGLRAVATGDAAGTRALHHPVGSSAWADELGTRLALMTDRGQHSASLRLSPEHLGPLEIRIAVRDDQASVWFGATHADTRAAIEQALPRLRELFASQGMSLADAGVFQEAPREQARLPSNPVSDAQSAAAETDAIARVGPIRLGLVDAYA